MLYLRNNPFPNLVLLSKKIIGEILTEGVFAFTKLLVCTEVTVFELFQALRSVEHFSVPFSLIALEGLLACLPQSFGTRAHKPQCVAQVFGANHIVLGCHNTTRCAITSKSCT